MCELNIQNFSVRIFWKNDTIEQLQMGVSAIATALVCTGWLLQWQLPSLKKWVWHMAI